MERRLARVNLTDPDPPGLYQVPVRDAPVGGRAGRRGARVRARGTVTHPVFEPATWQAHSRNNVRGRQLAAGREPQAPPAARLGECGGPLVGVLVRRAGILRRGLLVLLVGDRDRVAPVLVDVAGSADSSRATASASSKRSASGSSS